MICKHCGQEITGKAFKSKQPNLRGLYHWRCYLEVAKDANRQGAWANEQIIYFTGGFDRGKIE